MAGMSKSALNSGLARIGFQRDFCHFADAVREFPFLEAGAVRRNWKLFVPKDEPVLEEMERCQKGEMEEKKVREEELTPEEKAIAEFFGDDPFCCVPDFLIEDAKEFICKNKK
jgi:hypothetical protein